MDLRDIVVDKSSVILNFDDKFPQQELKENEKVILNSFL